MQTKFVKEKEGIPNALFWSCYINHKELISKCSIIKNWKHWYSAAHVTALLDYTSMCGMCRPKIECLTNIPSEATKTKKHTWGKKWVKTYAGRSA